MSWDAFSLSYVSSQQLIQAFKSDPIFLRLAQQLSVFGISGKDFLKEYKEIYVLMNDYISDWLRDHERLNPRPITIRIITHSGTLVYSNMMNIEQVEKEPNYNTNVAVNTAVSYANGNPIIVKDSKYPKEIANIVAAGYEVACENKVVKNQNKDNKDIDIDILMQTQYVAYTIAPGLQQINPRQLSIDDRFGWELFTILVSDNVTPLPLL